MAAKKAPPLPPSPVAREALLELIRGTAEPLMAKPLAKRLSAPHQIPEKLLVPILDEYVASGVLHRFPPKTAKGQPRYWDRDLFTIGRTAVIEALQHAAGPLTAGDLGKQLVTPLKFSVVELAPVLAELLANGTLHEIPPATAKGKPRYWNRDILDFGRLELSKLLAAKGPQTSVALRKGIKWLGDAQFEQLFQRLLSSQGLWRHPPLGKVKQDLFGHRPPSPEAYLHEVGSLLKNVVTKLTAARVSREDLRRAVVQIIEQAGIAFGATRTGASLTVVADATRNVDADAGSILHVATVIDAPVLTVSRAESVPSFPPEGVDLIALMKQLEPGAERGALISSRDLRRVARLEKSQFDNAVLDLSRQGRLSLHRHDYVSSLSPAERDELVSDEAGNYYVGMALRQSTR